MWPEMAIQRRRYPNHACSRLIRRLPTNWAFYTSIFCVLFLLVFFISPPHPSSNGGESQYNIWKSITGLQILQRIQQTVESVSMDPDQSAGEPKFWYSVWALPPDDVSQRAKKLMTGLRSEYGGPDFEPHVTVLGAISMTEADAINKFRSAVDGLKAYPATVERIATGTFYYQCVFLLLKPSPEIVEASKHCCKHFGFTNSTPYMPHLSLLYADLTEEEKKAALEKANAMDDSIGGLSFPITQLVLYKTDVGDKSTKSWEKIAECNLVSS